MVRIEPLNPQDMAVAMQIHAVLLLAHEQESALLNIQNAAPMERTVHDIQTSHQHHLGAFLGTELVGSVSLELDDEPGRISVCNLVVHPKHQRQGIGRQLMQEAMRRSGSGAYSVCATADNAPALALYRSLGFVQSRCGTIGPDAVPLVQLVRARPAL